MELRDFIVTPIWLFIIYGVAYWVRPRFTDANTKRYFIPALTVRIIGALAVGFVYQFYYGGGDTFTYHTRGSAVIWQAFMDNPANGIKLIFAGEEIIPELYHYIKSMWYYGDLNSYMVIRFAAIFDLFTFRTYSATAALFALFSFSGIWSLYLVFYSEYKSQHKLFAFAILFVPSVFFWGSGIFKDTLTLAALGWATYAFYHGIIKKKNILLNLTLLFISSFIIFSIKKYILLCFAPASVLWWYIHNISMVKSFSLKIIMAPVILLVCLLLGYYAVQKVGEDDPRYSIDRLAETVKITAYDIRYGWGARFGDGSGYTLGELDGSFGSMIRLFPSAVNVSLFRPYFWEVRNPLMLLSAIESFFVLAFTGFILFKLRLFGVFRIKIDPIVLFCLTFSIVFAFAVGVSTYNFGTLMRYKIPLMPFYLSALVVLYSFQRKNTTSKYEQ